MIAADRLPHLELRTQRRRRVLLSGLGFVRQTNASFDCTIKDLSEGGVKIEFRAGAQIPATFQLVDIKNRNAYEVQITRRTENHAGLKILRQIPLSESTNPEARALRRLLVERLNR